MKSFEVIRQAVDEPGVKAVAAALKVSPALVYKWCEAPADTEDPDQSGAKNPLDRVREMYLLTKDIRLVRWLCNEAGGFFVSNPVPDLRRSLDETIFGETRSMVRDFAALFGGLHDFAIECGAGFFHGLEFSLHNLIGEVFEQPDLPFDVVKVSIDVFGGCARCYARQGNDPFAIDADQSERFGIVL